MIKVDIMDAWEVYTQTVSMTAVPRQGECIRLGTGVWQVEGVFWTQWPDSESIFAPRIVLDAKGMGQAEQRKLLLNALKPTPSKKAAPATSELKWHAKPL